MPVIWGILAGAGAAVLLILAIEIPRYVLFCRRLDRRLALEIKLLDWRREMELRLSGVSEEVIADLSERIKARRGAWEEKLRASIRAT